MKRAGALRAGRWPALFVATGAAFWTAQTPVQVSGRVMDVEGKGVAAGHVTAHWFAPDGDVQTWSTTTRDDGSFELRLRPPAGAVEDAELLVSARHQGVEYSAPPIRGRLDRTDTIRLTVYDTAIHSTTPALLSVAYRRIFLRPSGSGHAEALDVIELANPSRRTWVAGPEGAVWRVALPERAESVQLVDAQVLTSSLRLSGDTLLVLGPLLPGHNQLMLQYFLPVGSGPFSLPLGAATAELELVIAESLGGRGMGALRTQGSMRIGDEPFRRFGAHRLEPGDDARFSLAPGRAGRAGPLVTAVLFWLLVGGAAFLRLRRTSRLAPHENGA